MTNYLGLDMSFAKTGWAIVEVKDRKTKLVKYGLIETDSKKASHERIDDTVTEIKFISTHSKPKSIVREASIVGRASTATPVIKTHGVFEHELSDRYDLHEIHGSTIKAWARKVLGVDGNRTDKKLVAEAVEKYYGKIDGLYTPRGRLLDDIADAIALITAWLEREGAIDERFKKENKKK